jgi:hypothetical protein
MFHSNIHMSILEELISNKITTIVDYDYLSLCGTHLPLQLLTTFKQTQIKLLCYFKKVFGYTYDDFIGILIYIDRLDQVSPNHYLFHNKGKRISPAYNSYYVLLTIILIYSKMYHDKYYSNKFYSEKTHLGLEILNLTEWAIFNNCCQFDVPLVISAENYVQMAEQIISEDEKRYMNCQ